jgi:hypothetical protein
MMNLNPHNARDVLNLLHAGAAFGGVLELSNAFHGLVESLTRTAADLRFRNASEYEVSTYVVHDPESRRGVVVKIASYRRKHLIQGLSREFMLLRELYQTAPASFRVPDGNALFALGGHLVSVTEMLDGVYLTECAITADEAFAAARAIAAVECALTHTSVGATLIAEMHSPYYARKAHQFIERVFPGKSSFNEGERLFSALEAARLEHPVVVSDRSPANLTVDTHGTVGVFDFGLLLTGTPFEDWSWFIDDPRLRTDVSRMELVRIFAEAADMRLDSSVETMFHRAAMFVNIKQCCIAAERRRAGVVHYLSRIRQSAEALSSGEGMRFVESLQILTPPGP